MTGVTLTAEEVQQKYDAAMDSVNLLDAGKPSDMEDADWDDLVDRNVAHLEIMAAKDYWTDAQDTSVLQTAIDTHSV